MLDDGVAVLPVVGDELPYVLDAVDHPVVPGGGQAPFVQQLVGLGEAVDVEALAGADAVHDHVERAGRGDAGVLLAQ